MRPDPGLVARIAAEPDAPEHRLAYAEWFEKHGDGARAELIRAQLALRTRLNPEQRSKLNKRVAVHGLACQQLLPMLNESLLGELQLLDEATAVPQLIRVHPWQLRRPALPVLLQQHRLTISVQDGKGLATAAGQPWFEQVRWLKLTGRVDAGAQAVTSAAHVGMLERLFLTGCLRLEEGIAPLLEAEWLRSLKWLALNRDELTDADVKQIRIV